jgi:diacylglycerol kinase (ATP)
MRLLVVINPHAAGGRPLRHQAHMEARLRQAGHELRVVVAPDLATLHRHIREAAATAMEGVLVAGGDGTLHQALPALVETSLPLGVLPCGRGNDFARNLGMSPRLETVLRGPLQFALDTIDLPRANGRPFLSIAGVGFDARVNQLACAGKGWFHGRAGYLVCVLRALRTFTPFAAQVRVDDRSWQGRLTLVAVANGPGYGGGIRIAPGADLRDGRFDVCIVGDLGRRELLANLPRLLRGRHLEHPRVSLWHGRRVEIETAEPQPIFADGEWLGTTPATCVLDGTKLRVLRPTG